VRVLRVIARLNMGGPAHHVSLLSGMLDRNGYETLLLHGDVGPGEASLLDVAARHGAVVESVPGLGPRLNPVQDLRALAALVRRTRNVRPDIVHTHTAKAGLLGRLAAVLAGRPRPLIVHTYHGHVLEGYFGPVASRLYRTLERLLARPSDVLIGVSEATVSDLVRLRVAPRSKFRVIPIGLDLAPFIAAGDAERAGFRAGCGAGPGDVLVTFVGRLVPIKRVDVALEAVARARGMGAPVRLAVVGDGELRGGLEERSRALGLDGAVRFLGYRPDMPAVAAGSDLALLSSDNEGTPVSLIEAAAAGRPAAATAVGGVPDVVSPATGALVPRGDAEALGAAVARLASDSDERPRMGQAARRHVVERFSVERLIRDIDELYAELGRLRLATGGRRTRRPTSVPAAAPGPRRRPAAPPPRR
jgi:glycosyltransferase involved in cell wall biosynthesis